MPLDVIPAFVYLFLTIGNNMAYAQTSEVGATVAPLYVEYRTTFDCLCDM
jgi:hypothetical protein